ncbi:radical SAM protein [Kribbella sp. NPDC050820]|uniref:radical SAM protein n=1 Tax=Kribbella sp. NPDC050820 TaxID=3155408 RepID=UPI0033E6BF49
MSGVSFVWLEITEKCRLQCVHCYAESGPAGSHGVMEPADWIRVIDETAELGVGMVQFIGGEPTLHPALPQLLAHALAAGLKVEGVLELGACDAGVVGVVLATRGAAGVFVLLGRAAPARGGDRHSRVACADPGEHRRGGTAGGAGASRCD